MFFKKIVGLAAFVCVLCTNASAHPFQGFYVGAGPTVSNTVLTIDGGKSLLSTGTAIATILPGLNPLTAAALAGNTVDLSVNVKLDLASVGVGARVHGGYRFAWDNGFVLGLEAGIGCPFEKMSLNVSAPLTVTVNGVSQVTNAPLAVNVRRDAEVDLYVAPGWAFESALLYGKVGLSLSQYKFGDMSIDNNTLKSGRKLYLPVPGLGVGTTVRLKDSWMFNAELLTLPKIGKKDTPFKFSHNTLSVNLVKSL